MNKVLDFFKQNADNKVLSKQIRVYGWQFEFDHLLTTSVCKYLFEDFKVIENIAPLNDVNRPGNIKKKHYVTVHDTGDTSSLQLVFGVKQYLIIVGNKNLMNLFITHVVFNT